MLSSFLCVVYPAFQAQYASVIFGILFLLFSIFLLSLILMLKAFYEKKNGFFLLIISLLFSLINLISIEYFFTLEILRYLIIYFHLEKEGRISLRTFFMRSYSYLSLYLAMIVRRLFMQAGETTYRYDLNFQPSSSSLINFLQRGIIDVWNASFGAWIYALYPHHLIETQSHLVIGITLTILFLVMLVGLMFFKNQIPPCDHQVNEIMTFPYGILRNRQAQGSSFLNKKISVYTFSLAALFCAGIPFWIADLPVGEQYVFSRWTIPFVIGASVLLSVLVLQIKKPAFVNLLASFLIALGVCSQILAGNSFRQDWNKVREYVAQFTWRIPSLQENTTIFSNYLDFNYENSDQISMALNLHYPSSDHFKIPLFQFYLPERVGTNLLPAIEPDLPLAGRRCYRFFQGSTSKSIVVDFRHPACLHVLDPEIDVHNPNIDDLQRESLFLSDLELISKEEKQMGWDQLESVFGPPPPADWCYYFEKADLARQYQDWETIDVLASEVEAKGLLPRDDREWFPFIEGCACNGRGDRAAELSRQVHEQSPEYEEMLQHLWERIGERCEPSLEIMTDIEMLGD